MNFFEAQEQARKASRKLVLWFSLCVLAVILLVYLVLVGSTIAAASPTSTEHSIQPAPGWWQMELFIGTVFIVGGVILIGSLSKLARLSGGGAVIASDLGGRRVDPSTNDPVERRLINVVEEMAIASGIAAPEVWVMDHESAINAFAAGTDPSNAVIGVTRGTLEQLTRAELQGVIAHEYSHILNGDMKLNMRLTGWIFGLVMVAMIGRLLMQSYRFMRGSRDSKGGGLILAIVLLGVAVWIIGSIGVLFARILQAAISRQREFLADAAAVQFTRHPDGISGALKKIGGFSDHGKIEAAKATEARHMFFASSSLSSMLATHPPIEERIRAIEPKWKGEMLKGGSDPVRCEDLQGALGFSGSSNSPPPIPREFIAAGKLHASGVPGPYSSANNPNNESSATPPPIEPDAATNGQATLFGLLIPADQQEQGRRILNGLGHSSALIELAIRRSNEKSALASRDKLAQIDASLPQLRQMTPDQGRLAITTIEQLIAADGQIDLFEFMLQQVCKRHIEVGIGLRNPPTIRFKHISQIEIGLANLLTIFSACTNDADALKPALEEYALHTSRELPTVEMDFGRAAQDLELMDASTPIVKKQILRLCWLTANQDGEINENEAELLRAVAESLGCALPRSGQAFADLQA